MSYKSHKCKELNNNNWASSILQTAMNIKTSAEKNLKGRFEIGQVSGAEAVTNQASLQKKCSSYKIQCKCSLDATLGLVVLCSPLRYIREPKTPHQQMRSADCDRIWAFSLHAQLIVYLLQAARGKKRTEIALKLYNKSLAQRSVKLHT